MMLAVVASGNRAMRTLSAPILIVDDDETIRTILAEALEDQGYGVFQAAGGEEGLRCIQGETTLRVLIADVRLPGISGLDLAELAQRARPELKVILISGFFLPRPVRHRLLKKPFHTHELVAAVAAELA